MSSKNICGIYCIENLSNGRKYIGQSRNIVNRFYDHRSRLRAGTHKNDHLQKAWSKYGEDSFSFDVVAVCPTDRLDYFERYYIDKYNSFTKDSGYNLDYGGNARKVLSEDTRRKISENHADVSQTCPVQTILGMESVILTKQWPRYSAAMDIGNEEYTESNITKPNLQPKMSSIFANCLKTTATRQTNT